MRFITRTSVLALLLIGAACASHVGSSENDNVSKTLQFAEEDTSQLVCRRRSGTHLKKVICFDRATMERRLAASGADPDPLY